MSSYVSCVFVLEFVPPSHSLSPEGLLDDSCHPNVFFAYVMDAGGVHQQPCRAIIVL